MSNAREQLALRNTLHAALTYTEIRDIRWHTLITEARPAIERGWTGDEIARWCIADIGGNPPDNVGAVMLTTIRRLANTDPPRDTTPSPTPCTSIQAQRAEAIAASANVDHAAWAARIKAQR